ncbi:haloacid dehalogenase [Niastella koreensis]|uniref:HAD-superfamily hydrolase, subfamily IIB n=2 Tax=Niastella koreensis TaxID=354356 RepID=G8T6U0_NIAKG|nr:HAD-IIB family hydrolase [Niastella koreensis]AEV97943.1 HAD-superfamily hydrolase, subfamily IIB [Niastella koreensis GR20-10]OQP40255.1 haloacid dehalogenase [Niastella koreensis]
MRYLCLAADYDGTLATHGKVEQEVIEALYRLKASTRQLILVTGRVMEELKVVFPGYEIFDRIVAENGALLYKPATKEERLLGERPPEPFINELHRQVKPLSVGKVIVATWEPHQNTVLEAIKKEGLELQVIFNKGAVMILPAGINKAKGLKETLKEMNMSLHNVVAVGDAENDNAMLNAAECAVAVSNALPAVQHHADWITDHPHGKGVIQLIDRLLENDLQDVDCKLTRHYLNLGQRTTGEDFSVCPYGPNILLSGTTKSGKSTMATFFLEKLLEKNYQFCLIDPEGDYLQQPGAVRIGDSEHAPAVEEVLSLLNNPMQSVIVSILAIPLDDRPRFFNSLLSALSQMRKETGHPHWIIADEAHHMLPAPAAPSYYAIPDDFKNFAFISLSTEGMNEAVLNKITLVISMGDDAAKAIMEFSRFRNIQLKENAVTPLQKGQAWVWDVTAGNEPVLIKTGIPVHLQQRHKKKYATGDMDYNSFYFRGPENKLNLKAYNLIVFTQMASGIDDETWFYHLKRKDYSNWLRHSVHDEELAALVNKIEIDEQYGAGSRQAIVDLINDRYTA